MKPAILITSGPTREFLDPVRFISNASSGKMGRALVAAALSRKLPVSVISGPVEITYPRGSRQIFVTSAEEMLDKVKSNLEKADIVIGAAAVSDYRPARLSPEKIKKNQKKFTLNLKKNPDIVAFAGKKKRKRVVVGFALETENLIKNAKKKLAEKNLDLIVANYPESIGSARSSVLLVSKDGGVRSLKNLTKARIAQRIMNEAIRIWENNSSLKTHR